MYVALCGEHSDGESGQQPCADVEFQVHAAGVATKHMVDARELVRNVGMILSYQIGPYHYIIRRNLGIEMLADMGMQTFNSDTSIQTFQDDKIDLIILPADTLSPAIQQFGLTKEIRILDVDYDKLKINAVTDGTVARLQAMLAAATRRAAMCAPTARR